ncbi:MAG TPA: hypothetical protein VMR19_04080 [Candidatus Saccharimonadales bacterium]|jgi:hypothetical protein|nr:hypothetical protein [Candidatus Saccharimonadales bacterium]
MPKDQNIQFDDLEKLGESKGEQKTFSEEELIGILSDREKLAAVYKESGVDFLRILFDKLAMSKEFRIKAIEILEQINQKP